MSPMTFSVTRSASPMPSPRREQILANPGFGTTFTDHMFTATWTTEDGWGVGEVVPYGPLTLDPACAVLHYGQEIFEGLKAYRHDDGTVWAFRAEANAARFARSARRLALPELPTEDFVGSIRALVDVDQAWVPTADGTEASLYLRPFMIASEAFLGVRPAHEVLYCIIASPAGAYFATGLKPVSIWVSSDYTRAAPGGTGAAKCGGNYAASLAAQVQASGAGCDQVVFLDAIEQKWVEELGGMNVFFVRADGSIQTPELTGTILEGITRSSIMTMATERGYAVSERRISIDEWRADVASGAITEVFACGTAAVITPIGRLAWDGGEIIIGGNEVGPVAAELRHGLLDIQYGRARDTNGWMTRLA